MELQIKVLKYTGKTREGKAFDYFKCINKDGKKVDIKFTKTCTNVPKETCTIVVNEANANLDTTRLYPCVWIKEVEEIIPVEHKSLEDYFN